MERLKGLGEKDACGQCPGKIEVPTEKEREALLAMKSIKAKVRELKMQMERLNEKGLSRGGRELGEIENELEHLRKEWDVWEDKRKRAARERMVLLGHEQA